MEVMEHGSENLSWKVVTFGVSVRTTWRQTQCNVARRCKQFFTLQIHRQFGWTDKHWVSFSLCLIVDCLMRQKGIYEKGFTSMLWTNGVDIHLSTHVVTVHKGNSNWFFCDTSNITASKQSLFTWDFWVVLTYLDHLDNEQKETFSYLFHLCQEKQNV